MVMKVQKVVKFYVTTFPGRMYLCKHVGMHIIIKLSMYACRYTVASVVLVQH